MADSLNCPPSSNDEDVVRVVLELPKDVVDWIDGITDQLGLSNRSTVVAAMLRELHPDSGSSVE